MYSQRNIFAYSPQLIGSRIKEERKKLGISQTELAEKLYYESKNEVSKWERGIKLPSFDRMLVMCQLFGCELGYLVGEYDCKTRQATDICKTTGLSEVAVTKLIEYNDLKHIAQDSFPQDTDITEEQIQFMHSFSGNLISIVDSFITNDVQEEIHDSVVKGKLIKEEISNLKKQAKGQDSIHRIYTKNEIKKQTDELNRNEYTIQKALLNFINKI